jgi:hypothetical protein
MECLTIGTHVLNNLDACIKINDLNFKNLPASFTKFT